MSTPKDTSLEIQTILDKNRVHDLKHFLNKRQCLNATNVYLIYLFHLVQSAGILTTSFAAGNNNTNLVWIGVGLNFLASLISVYEKTNSSLLKKILNDIKLIKEGSYIDEGELIDTENLNVQNQQISLLKAKNSAANKSNTKETMKTQLNTPLLNSENNNEKDPIKIV